MDTNEGTTEQDKRVKLYLMNQNWLKIRKQKDRKETASVAKLWKMRQMYLSKTGRLRTLNIDNIGKKVEKIIEKDMAELKRVGQQLALRHLFYQKV